MGRPVVHFEIASANAAAAAAFYSKLFGWKIDDNNPMKYGIIDTAGAGGIQGGVYQADANTPPGVMIYVAVKDTDQAARQAEALGGKIIRPTEVIPGMVTFALIADPAGTVIGLVKDEMPASAPKPAKKKAAVRKKSSKVAKKAGKAKKVGKKKAKKKARRR